MHVLTDQQRKQWAIDGYIHLEGVLSPEEVQFFSDEIDRLRPIPGWEPSPDGPLGHYKWLDHASDLDPNGPMDRRDLLPFNQAFIDLMDKPEVFDLVTDIMGTNILLSMTQAIVRSSTDKWPGYTHTDGGEALRRIRVTETSLPLAMKALFLLNDMHDVGSGNFTVFPGSHMRPFPEREDRILTPTSPGAVPLTGSAGDCILFQHSLWHGPGRNTSGRSRKTLLYNYCQLFMRAYDFETVSEVKDRCTPRQRRLLGDLGYDFRPGSYIYAPEDQVEIIRGGSR